jgi:hypothetical protein
LILRLSFAMEVYGLGMKRCTVSVIDGDCEPHQAVNAASLFDAVDQARAVVAAVVVQRRRRGGGSRRKPPLAGVASARYFVAQWKG